MRDQPVSLMSNRLRFGVNIGSKAACICFLTRGVTSDRTRSRPGSAKPKACLYQKR